MANREKEKKGRENFAINNTKEILWVIDLATHLKYVSPSVKKILGYEVQEALQKKIKDILPALSLKKAMQVLKNSISFLIRGPLTLELEHICKDGSTITVEVTADFIRNEEGKIEGVIGISRNITEFKYMQENFEKMNKQKTHSLKVKSARDGRILQLKKEVNALLKELGKPPKYS
jgi:PAS domain S-box-containing protein